MKPHKITFMPNSDKVETNVSAPLPARKYIPKWYRDIPVWKPKDPEFNYLSNGTSEVIGRNVRSCVPFLDALTGGYIQETWTDIYISRENDEIKVHQSIEPEVFSVRNAVAVEIGPDFYPIEFIWKSPWRAVLPKGWSLLITHPLNRVDLPFVTLSGIIDSDVFYHARFGNLPFYVKAGFEGMIPAGTPMFQLIPIRRESWESEALPYDQKRDDRLHSEMYKKFWGAYRDKFWHKKMYN